MQLETLKLKNFRSFGNKLQTVNLDHLGLTLLDGHNKDDFQSNGAGKSSLLEAIVYALYGKTSDGQTARNLVNRKTGKNMFVGLVFTKGKDKYEIKRYRHDSKNKNKTFLYLNGKNITSKSVKDTNEQLEHIIGIDMKTYLHSYMFGLGKGASFASMTDKQKKAILDDMANLAIYPIARSVSKNDADKIKDKLLQIKSKVDATTYEAKTLSSLQNKAVKDESNYQNQLDSIKDQLIKQKKLSLHYSTKYSAYRASKLIKHIEYDLTLLRPKLSNYDEIKTKYEAEHEQLQQIINKYMVAKRNNDAFHNKINDCKSKIIALAKKKQQKCYWCGQILNASQRKHEMKMLALQIVKYIKSDKSVMSNIKSLQSSYKSELKLVKHDKDNIPNVNKIVHVMNVGNQRINHLKDEARNAKSVEQKLQYLQKQYQSLQNQHIKTDHSKDIKSTGKKLKEQRTKFNALKTKLKLYKESEKVYSNHGVRSAVLDLILPFINKQANHYLELLSNGDISLEIVPTTTSKSTGNTSEKINLKITNNHGADDYKGLSSGEKKRVDLSILLSLQDYVLSKSSTTMNLVCFDELFSHLDAASIGPVMKILYERLKYIPNIIVTTHQKQLQQCFSNRLIVTKRNGSSRVVQK